MRGAGCVAVNYPEVEEGWCDVMLGIVWEYPEVERVGGCNGKFWGWWRLCAQIEKTTVVWECM